jgi:hypothetical protein
VEGAPGMARHLLTTSVFRAFLHGHEQGYCTDLFVEGTDFSSRKKALGISKQSSAFGISCNAGEEQSFTEEPGRTTVLL